MEGEHLKRISKERKLTFGENDMIQIVAPCTLNNGIVKLNKESWELFNNVFAKDSSSACFFIPASGTGSRMFEFLYKYLEDASNENLLSVSQFFKNINSFAFYYDISDEWKEQLKQEQVDWISFLKYLMDESGKNYGNLPKAIFPFHKYDDILKSPVEEHLFQIELLKKTKMNIHFTINDGFQKIIDGFIKNEPETSMVITYSHQNPATNSYVFDKEANVVVDMNGNYLRRPAGHGALLENLNTLNSRLIFVKNIDNVQCRKNMQVANEYLCGLAGLLLDLKSQLKNSIQTKNQVLIGELNDKYALFHESEYHQNTTWDEIALLANRPMRICGMVPNEGQPGGGPFWAIDKGITSKQIVEKSQLISPSNLSHLINSTHFNPVIMVIDKTNLDGAPCDLSEYTNDNLGLVVNKNHQGKQIKYSEKPGLWNGAMYHWSSVFVEVPISVFSPVKNVMDLLDPSHSCNELKDNGSL